LELLYAVVPTVRPGIEDGVPLEMFTEPLITLNQMLPSDTPGVQLQLQLFSQMAWLPEQNWLHHQ
jgi:hypothetical protein